jgi:hypothetical protein
MLSHNEVEKKTLYNPSFSMCKQAVMRWKAGATDPVCIPGDEH